MGKYNLYHSNRVSNWITDEHEEANKSNKTSSNIESMFCTYSLWNDLIIPCDNVTVSAMSCLIMMQANSTRNIMYLSKSQNKSY
jgi:hypothetical protein